MSSSYGDSESAESEVIDPMSSRSVSWDSQSDDEESKADPEESKLETNETESDNSSEAGSEKAIDIENFFADSLVEKLDVHYWETMMCTDKHSSPLR